MARPLELLAFEIDATGRREDDHVATWVKSDAEPSENVPIAVNCRVPPFVTIGSIGVTSIDTSIASVTVSVVEPLTPINLALTWVVPGEIPVARPSES